jgi:L-threonylcarbamoyladenylate synthase
MSGALEPTDEDFRTALAALREGRVVAAATESSFGFLCDAENAAALDRLLAVKSRGAEKGVGLILPDAAAWETWVESLPPLARFLGDSFWPGPLSVVLPARATVDSRLILDGTIAVRVPGPSSAQRLAREFGRAVTATSANLPGEPPILDSREIGSVFAQSVQAGDLLALPGLAPGGAPSTLVRFVGAELEVVRPGALPADRVQQVAAVLRRELGTGHSGPRS